LVDNSVPGTVPNSEAIMAAALTPLLGDVIYISGGVIGAILVILLIVWLLRRT
jgi:hypothetical protein